MANSNKKTLALAMSLLLLWQTAIPIFAAGEEDINTNAEISADIPEETVETSIPEETLEPAETAAPEYIYEIEGLGEVKSASAKNLSTSSAYYEYKCVQSGVYQSAFAVVASVERGAFLRGVSLGENFGVRGKVSELYSDDDELLAAVNADFFSTTTGVPMGVFVEEGRFVSSSDKRAAIGINKDGEVFIGNVGDRIWLEHKNEDLAISYLNKYPTVYGAYLLTRDFGETTRLSAGVAATEYIIDLSRDIEFGSRVRGKITEIRKGVVNGEIPEDCAVLVVPDLYPHSAIYANMKKGDRVYIESEANEEFEDVYSAIGGGDIILRDGELTDTLEDEAIETARNPRTAVGITANGEIVMLVVDGRRTGYSSGVKMTALALAMRDMGCVSAINLDGGGSSVMALFSEEGSTIVNRPSDNTERRVPNAVALYEDSYKIRKLHTLDFSAPETLLFSGVSIPLSISLLDKDGEIMDFELNEKNTGFILDERFGSVEFVDGVPHFTAGDVNGLGKIRAEVTLPKETITADIFVRVTNTLDSLSLDQTVIFAESDAVEVVNVTAMSDGERVYFGNLLEVASDNEAFKFEIDGENFSVSTTADDVSEIPEETMEEVPAPEETESAEGVINVKLGDNNAEIFAYFGDELTISLNEHIFDALYVENEGYTISYSEESGIFRVESPIPEIIEVEETTVPEETIAPEETTVPEETTAPEETTVPEETTAPEETEVPEETTVPEEIAEPEPFDVKINVSEGSFVTRGLDKKQVWMWVDGLCANADPYAVLTVETEEGTVEKTVYYDKYYDFLGYNGRALLTLDLNIGEGIASVKTLLGYTADAPVQSITFGPLVMTKNFETNLYADTAEHWSAYFVNALSYMGIINGSENLEGALVYNPDSGLTREQFAKILVNYLQIDTLNYEETVLDFADNDEIAPWAVPYVKAAVGAGLMKGRSTPADTVIFAPTDGIKRQEAIYVLGGLLGECERKPLEFTDSASVAPWAAENLEKALFASLISGYDDGSIRPEGGITRAEAATLVIKLYEFTKNN